MIEVHPNRSEAAVDPLQPLEYEEFMNNAFWIKCCKINRKTFG